MLTIALLTIVLARAQAAELKVHAPEKVDVCASVWTPVIPLKVARPEKLEGPVKWAVVSAPSGVRVSIVPGEKDSAQVYLRGFCSGPEPDSRLVVSAAIGDKKGETAITLTRGQARVLLVDDDGSDNNVEPARSMLSESDKLYRRLLLEGDGLRSLPYDATIVGSRANGPGLDVLQKYDAVVWYTAAEYGGNPDQTAVLSKQDLANLSAFLAKGKSAILFSPGLLNNYQGYFDLAGRGREEDARIGRDFLLGPMGVKGGRGLVHRFNEGDVQATGGGTFHLAKGKPVETQISWVDLSSAKPLFVSVLNPDSKGARPVPCGLANTTERGTVVYIGFSFEDIADNVGDAFRIAMTPGVGWGAPVPSNVIAANPVGAQAQAPVQPARKPAPPEIGGPSTPPGQRPKTPADEKPHKPDDEEARIPKEADEPQNGAVAFVAPSPADNARFDRLGEIARALQDPKSDGVALVTEAVRLCGLSVWTEDRKKIAGPSADPSLHLAVTDFEIQCYVGMFRSGHWVALKDLIAALDYIFERLGVKESLADYVNGFLELGPSAANMSVRALTMFLHDLGAYHGGGLTRLSADDATLDPIQALLIMRVITEDVAPPNRKLLAASNPGHNRTASARAFAPGRGLHYVAFGAAQQGHGASGGSSHVMGLAEEGYTTIVPGVVGQAMEHDAHHEIYTHEGQELANLGTGLSIVNMFTLLAKFIMTYHFMKVDLWTVLPPGEPLVRTQNTIAGQERTIKARVLFDERAPGEKLSTISKMMAVMGVELDLPKPGPLAHVATDWDVIPGYSAHDPIVIRHVHAAPETDGEGYTTFTVEGMPQSYTMDPKTARPVERANFVQVTPAAKDLGAASTALGVISVLFAAKEGPMQGFLRLAAESLLRAKWHPAGSHLVHIKDWVDTEAVGQLDVDIDENRRESKTDYKTYQRDVRMSLSRHLKFREAGMTALEVGLPPPEFMKMLKPEQRQRAEQAAQEVQFWTEYRRSRPGKDEQPVDYAPVDSLTISDELDESSIQEVGECGPSHIERESCTKMWTFHKEQAVGQGTHIGWKLSFSVTLNKVTKVAKLKFTDPVPVPVDFVHNHTPAEKGQEPSGKKSPYGILKFLELAAPGGQNAGGWDPKEQAFVIPVTADPAPGGQGMNYRGTISVPFRFGPSHQFDGKARISFSISQKRKRLRD